MTELNSPQITDRKPTRLMFWGTLTLAAILAFVAVYSILITLQLPQSAVTYFGLVMYTLILGGIITSIVLTIRRRQELGAQLALYLLFAYGVILTGLTQGEIASSSPAILIIGILATFGLFREESRQRLFSINGAVFAVMWIIEWINPPWRIGGIKSANLGPGSIIVFVLVLGFFIARQAWSGNIRVKIITAFSVVALVSLGILGTVTYFNYRNQVREDIRQRLLDIVSVSAIQLDGDLHSTLKTPADMQTEAYQQMLALGDEIVASDPDLIYAYTMRMNEQGQIYFVIDSRRADDLERDPIGTVYEEPSEALQAFFNAPDRPVVEEEIYTDKYGSVLSAFAPFYRADGSLEGVWGVDIAADVVVKQERNVLYLILGTILGALILVTLLGLWLGNIFTKPILNLSATAQKFADGNLSERAEIETTDEVGDLAGIFNTMTSQLQETLEGLEQRVAERTQNLELAAEVGRSVSQVRELNIMLRDACQLILKEFDLYYVQVYLADAQKKNLVLEAGTGDVGIQLLSRAHSLPFDTSSLNGRAAIDKRAVVIPDTTLSPTFRANPLLPDTRGEMAVPLIVSDQVVGVLDMQTINAGKLNEEALPAFEALAGQLAVAIQNATLVAEANEARAEVETQARRLVRRNWNEHLDAIHKPEEIGFVFAQDQITPLAETDTEQLIETEDEHPTLSSPIAVTGEELGSLIVELADDNQDEQATELVDIVARQVAQQIENLRLLEEAERYRREAEEVSRRQTRAGWEAYMQARKGKSISYLYDSVKVIPLDNEEKDNYELSLPLRARNEEVGKLAVKGIAADDEEMLELTQAVAERLGAQIENLRLFEESQTSLAETAKALGEVERLGSAVQQSVDGMAIASMDGNLEFVNAAWAKMHGYEVDEIESLLGQPLSIFHTEEQLQEEVLPFNQIVEKNGLNQGEVGHKRKDGSTFPTWMTVSVMTSDAGVPLALVASAQDITERKKAEEALRESQERAQTILESITLPMVITRISTNTYSFVNQLAADAVGLSIDQMVGSPVIDFYAHPKEREKFASQLRNEGRVDNMQMQLKRKNGETFWALLSARIFTYEDAPSILTTIVDISERIAAQEAVTKRAAELATVAKISTQVTSLHETEEILQSVVDLSKENFGLYHAHIYMLDEATDNLVLAAGAGEAGAKMVAEGWQIPLSRERSLVARAAREKQGVIVNNVREEEGFMANPLLPNTAAELAVPLIVGNAVLGVLDIQSDEVDYFSDADLNIQTTLAAQVAVTIQNMRAFKAAQEQAEYEAKINLINQRIQSTTNVEEALQVAVRELGRALGAKQASIQLNVGTKKQ